MNFAPSSQNLSPPLKGVFPLDHARSCTPLKDAYLACLKAAPDGGAPQSTLCKEGGKAYLLCRMEKDLMKKEGLENLGFGTKEEATVEGKGSGQSLEGGKEKEGFVSGKHMKKQKDGWLW